MGRKRKHYPDLPRRMTLKHGAFYYIDLNNKWHKLASVPHLAKAYEEYDKIAPRIMSDNTMEALLERYRREILPTKAKTTQENERYNIQYLRVYFGKMRPTEITPVLVYRYQDIRGQESVFSANKDIAILSRVFSKAIKWGLVSDNPCANIEKLHEPKRERIVGQSEYDAVYQLADSQMQIAMSIASSIALREFDVMNLVRQNILDEGLKVWISKVKKWQLFLWQPEFKAQIERALKANHQIKSMYLLRKENGRPYTRNGFRSSWRRLMAKAIKEGVIKQKFSFNDLRAKAASDAERKCGREYARALLGHTTQKTTAIYIRDVVAVEALR